ncbi:hypothetical protein AVT43_gp34 [Polaribacter phage P12002L]|uniref:Uncharacterized protein n=1 Tax=Polaribacter phage P12002L TaxID=1647386 RepID=A0A0F7IKF7_9CAUD|nr:hypothetical protein AVT43_gp34 [Polaribacter phage P12002L]AKG94208.1 hypothetical protein P12002L_0034 [Polaribacter phage P12002L]
MKLKAKLFFFTISVILLVYFFNSISNKNETIKRQESNIKALKDSTTYFKNKLGQTVATKLALQLTEKELKEEIKNNESLKIALKKFKKPIAVIQTKQEVKIDTVFIKYKDTIPFVFRRFERVKKDYYTLDLLSTNKGNTVSNFKLKDNEQTFVIGDKKKSIFSDSELRLDITNSNPLFNQKEIKPIVVVYKKSWYENPLITIPIGFGLGLLVD